MIRSPWKNHFPALADDNINYLDSAATTQVPQLVIDSIGQYLSSGSGNPGRGSYSQSENSTQIIENCRRKVARFINGEIEQVIFTKSATESINLVAQSFNGKLNHEDSILVTQLEHHANLLPWQHLCEQTGARLKIIPMHANGELDLSSLDDLLKDRCRLLAVTHCSNVIGITNSVSDLCKRARKQGVLTLIDGAQSVSHGVTDVKKIDCDFYAFSGHKIYASGGAGVLFARAPSDLQPLLLGGGIVTKVTNKYFELQTGYKKLEAGSTNVVAITALAAAIDFVNAIGLDTIGSYEKELTTKLYNAIDQLENFHLISHPNSSNIVSFYHKIIHCHDIASVLAESGISIRAGHHCAQPCLQALGIKHCLRVSIGLYNGEEDITSLLKGLENSEYVLK